MLLLGNTVKTSAKTIRLPVL